MPPSFKAEHLCDWTKQSTFSPASKMELHFVKYILNVHKKCSNFGVMSETGRIPIILDSFKASSNYWYRIQNMTSGLLKDAYNEAKNIHEEGGKSWFSAISNMFDIMKTPGGNKYKMCSKSSVKHIIKTDLTKLYTDIWYKHRGHLINENGKLRTYVQIKTNFGYEKYLDLIDESKTRKTVTKFKISSHKLKIEFGRYTKPLTPIEERLCDKCDMREVEDENHFFNNCTHFSEERLKLFDIIKESNINFHSLSPSNKIFWTFNCENKIILNSLGKFLLEAGIT